MVKEEQYLIFIVVSSSLVVLFLIAVVIDLVLLYRGRKRLADKELELRQSQIDDLLRKQEIESVNALLKGQNDERRRIARELHDRLGSLLFTAKLHYRQVQKSIESLKAEQERAYSEVNNLLDEAVDEVRRISHDLYEGSLAKFGFRTALKQLIEAIMAANPLKITFDDEGIAVDIYKDFERDLYRIMQELLSNSLKHSEAKSISIKVSQKENIFMLTYRDDGKGMDLDKAEKADGIGLQNIKDRVAEIGGEMALESEPGLGFEFKLTIDLNHESDKR
jgi:two-component system NarL family sensor kinase